MSKLSTSDWLTIAGILLPILFTILRFMRKVIQVWERIARVAETILPRLARIDSRMDELNRKVDTFLKER